MLAEPRHGAVGEHGVQRMVVLAVRAKDLGQRFPHEFQDGGDLVEPQATVELDRAKYGCDHRDEAHEEQCPAGLEVRRQ